MGICHSQDWLSQAVLPFPGDVFSAALDVGVLDRGVRKGVLPVQVSANPPVDVTVHSKHTEPEGPELVRISSSVTMEAA